MGWTGGSHRDAENDGPAADWVRLGGIEAYQDEKVPIQFRIPCRATMTEEVQRFFVENTRKTSAT